MTSMTPREHAIATICPLSGEPKTIYEINMVKMLTEFAERVKVDCSTEDTGCICRGNWRAIVKETESLIGTRFRDHFGDEFVFFGIVHSNDDYYYGMNGEAGLRLLSCVGSIKGHNFTQID